MIFSVWRQKYDGAVSLFVKIGMVMRLSLILILYSVLQVHAGVSAQDVTVKGRHIPLDQVFKTIETQTGYMFLYRDEVLAAGRPLDLDLDHRPLKDALEQVFRRQPLYYTILEKNIVVKIKPAATAAAAVTADTLITLTGKITDKDGVPLQGATIQVKGTPQGTATLEKGNFSIKNVSPSSVIIVSFTGYESREIALAGKSDLAVSLVSSTAGLGEIVVVGYGQQKKVSLTGAVDAVKGSQLAERPVANVSQALQGVSPGTTIINSGGAPGIDDATIRIRGYGTFGNNNPLILVDGVTVNNMNNIDPKDIENISILKDAASAAIYGSRAANGVILITTKRGKAQPVSVSYSAYAGLQSLTRQPEWVSTADYMRLSNEAVINAGKEPKYTEEAIQKTMDGTDPYKYPNTDWWGLLYHSALQQKHTVTITAGSEKIRSAISLFYLDKEGVMINTAANQFGLRANNDIVLSNKLDMTMDLSLNKRHRTAPARIEDVYWNLFHDVPPTIVSQYPDGTYQLGPTSRNPLAAARESGYTRDDNYQGIINSSLNWRPLEGLKLSGRLSLRENFEEGKTYNNNYTFKDYDSHATVLTWKSSLNQWTPKEEYVNLQATADYEKKLAGHYFHVLLGYSQEHDAYKDLSASRTDFYSNNLQELNVGSDIGKSNAGSMREWALRSAFGRLNYSWNDKYLFEANFRYDGSSRFAKGNRWGFFPSFSAGYRISEEPFWQAVKPVVNEFKIRGSWGQLGNQDIDLYQFIQTVTLGQNYTFGGQLANGAAQVDLANKLISWEATTASNIGFDMSLLNNRITVTADFYNRVTDKILLKRDIPYTVGLGAPTQNVGSVKNTGWEVAVAYNNAIGEFKYNVNFNISDVRNRILKYGEASVSGWTITREGESMNSLYGYVTEGLFQSDDEVTGHAFQNTGTGAGDIRYKNMNKDDIINDQDKVVLGSTIPRYTYGLTIGGKFRGWDATLFFNGVGKCYGYQEGALIEGPIWDGFTTKEMLDRWTPEHRNASWPRLVYQTIHNEQPSDWWIQNTSYFRFKNFQLGYTFPQEWLNILRIKNFRVYASGENVFMLTKARNLDPEFTSGRANFYPQTKIYTAGIDVTF